MILTDDKELYETIVCLNNHGRKIGEKGNSTSRGWI